MQMDKSQTSDFLVARFLLTPGRKHEGTVKDFSPYTETEAPDMDARAAGRELINKAKATIGRPSFLFVNNRLEGNALNMPQLWLT